MDHALMQRALDYVRAEWPAFKPELAMILGSGWSDAVAPLQEIQSLAYDSIPGIGTPGVVGHAGRLVWARHAGMDLMLVKGRRHFYEGHGWTPVAIPLYLMRQLGVSKVLLTNAAGGIRADLVPGSLMVIADHINLMGTNPLLGAHHPVWGPRFPDQSEVYPADLRTRLHRAGKSAGVPLFEGTYLAGSGPAYETPAEIRAWRVLGADAVGMSTVPEALLASAAGLKVAGLSCITNAAAGISAHPLTHEEVTATTRASMDRMKDVLRAFCEEIARG